MSVFCYVVALAVGVYIPVGRVQRHGVDFDEDIIVTKLRQRDVLDLSISDIDDLDGLHGVGRISHCYGRRLVFQTNLDSNETRDSL